MFEIQQNRFQHKKLNYQINWICTAAAIRLRQINKYNPNRQQMNEKKKSEWKIACSSLKV